MYNSVKIWQHLIRWVHHSLLKKDYLYHLTIISPHEIKTEAEVMKDDYYCIVFSLENYQGFLHVGIALKTQLKNNYIQISQPGNEFTKYLSDISNQDLISQFHLHLPCENPWLNNIYPRM